MIDPMIIREKPELVKENLRKRYKDPKLADEFLKYDIEWRKKQKELDNLRHERNKKSSEIAKVKKSGGDISEVIAEVKKIDSQISELEKEVKLLNEKRISILYKIPNILAEDVPIAESEEGSVTIKKWGSTDKVLDITHDQILEKLNLLDTKKASEISGARFYYLKNQLVQLNLALIQFTINRLIKRGFTPLWVPYMIKEEYMKGAAELEDFKETLYKIEGENLYLIPSAEQAIVPFHAGEIFQEGELPKKYVGFSTNFRREAGAHGRDTKGIFRVHQFDKVEKIIFSKPEESWKMFDLMVETSEEVIQKLGLPYRLINIASGDLNNSAAKKIDLEAWIPTQGKYRELMSCSNCTDYQARNLKIRVARSDGSIEYAHILNCTGIATERALVAIATNYYEDGKISVPKALRKYVDFEVIG